MLVSCQLLGRFRKWQCGKRGCGRNGPTFTRDWKPNVWVVAAQLVPLVLRHRLHEQPTWEFTRRILVDDHFEFRGGHKRDNSWSGVLTRVEDG